MVFWAEWTIEGRKEEGRKTKGTVKRVLRQGRTSVGKGLIYGKRVDT